MDWAKYLLFSVLLGMSSLCLVMLFPDPAFDHCIAVFDDPMFENDRISSCWRFEVSSVLPGIIDAM